MKKLKAKKRVETIPSWAILERALIRTMNETPELVMEKYVQPNGYLKWPVDPNYTSIDALDDMYESFHNWPLFYLLGGHEKFLSLSHREYDAITEQFTHYSSGHGHPIVVKEYEQGYDWMHQGEGYLFFYLLNLADPKNTKNRKRSENYAGFLLNEDPDALNYDPQKKMLKCCYLGSKGPGHRNFDDTPWLWADWKQWYGLPFNDLEGITTIDDMRDEGKAKRMAEVMRKRLAYSDTVINLMSTSMVMNAYLHTGAQKYKDWILEYTAAWRERTKKNGGLVPDNVGRNGEIGGEMGGNWYGGYYGWTWPHGFYFIADALTIACENEALLTGDRGVIGWIRSQYDRLLTLAVEREGTLQIPQKHSEPGAVQEYAGTARCMILDDAQKTTANPDFHRLLEIDGWYEFCPLPAAQPAHLWFMSREERDFGFIRRIRDKRDRAWEQLNDFYSKYQGGQDHAWLNYLDGGYQNYPEEILKHNIKQTYGRMKFMREDTEDPASYTDAYLQRRNPVTVEGLVHLTLGGPMPIYNGGLLTVSVLYFDADKKRPGLPEDTAALVSAINTEGITLTVINTSPAVSHTLIIQGGAFGEHRFVSVSAGSETTAIDANLFELEVPAASEITMEIKMDRYSLRPAYQWPFENDKECIL
ncbi:MAG: hypothetical protein LBQ38_01165 [Spirochaetaceae bacterium]|jgi:hypothetical protein|nr:hypothetical protein [Spirochaetaceae bacterium]